MSCNQGGPLHGASRTSAPHDAVLGASPDCPDDEQDRHNAKSHGNSLPAFIWSRLQLVDNGAGSTLLASRRHRAFVALRGPSFDQAEITANEDEQVEGYVARLRGDGEPEMTSAIRDAQRKQHAEADQRGAHRTSRPPGSSPVDSEGRHSEQEDHDSQPDEERV